MNSNVIADAVVAFDSWIKAFLFIGLDLFFNELVVSVEHD